MTDEQLALLAQLSKAAVMAQVAWVEQRNALAEARKVVTRLSNLVGEAHAEYTKACLDVDAFIATTVGK